MYILYKESNYLGTCIILHPYLGGSTIRGFTVGMSFTIQKTPSAYAYFRHMHVHNKNMLSNMANQYLLYT